MLELDVQRAGGPEGKVDVKWAEKTSWHRVETRVAPHCPPQEKNESFLQGRTHSWLGVRETAKWPGEDGAVIDQGVDKQAWTSVQSDRRPGDPAQPSEHKNYPVIAMTVVPPKACTKVSLVPPWLDAHKEEDSATW